MTQTSSGPICDVCGKYILPIFDERMYQLKIEGIEKVLDAHSECGAQVHRICAQPNGTWKDLPEGPLRKAFEKQHKELFQ